MFTTRGEHTDDHDPVQRRVISWSDAQNKLLQEYYCSNSRLTPSEFVLASLDPHIFEGVSETDITKWCRNNNKTISSTRKTSTLKDAIDIPNLFAASPTDIDSILIPIPGCKFVLTGDDVQSKNPRTDSHGLAYEFCFPITTIKDSENVKKSLGQFYTRLIDITEDEGIRMEMVKSKGVALTDCIWNLVLSNIACLGRVATVTKGKNQERWICHC